MIHTITANTVSEASLKTLRELLGNRGVTITNSDKGIVRTLGSIFVEISPCDYKWLSLEGRNNSLVATLAEIVWVLSGSNILDGWMDVFLRRAKEYSDNGHTWRAGYGPRIYSYGQIDTVLNRLRRQPYTRQAVMSIYDPALDTETAIRRDTGSPEAVTKDMPCNDMLMWDISNEALNVTVLNRSNDWAWGAFSINYQEFRTLQDILASILNVRVGSYRLYSNNMHLYIENQIVGKQVQAILDIEHTPVPIHTSSKNGDRVYPSVIVPPLHGSISDWSQENVRHLFGDLIQMIQTHSKEVASGRERITDLILTFLERHGVSPSAELYSWGCVLFAEYMCRLDPQSRWNAEVLTVDPNLRTAILHDRYTSNLRNIIT